MVRGKFSMKNIRISLDAIKLNTFVDLELEKLRLRGGCLSMDNLP